ncbi:hypothetical protein D3C84_1164960 [compost metagenome]
MRQRYAHAAINRLLRRRLSERASHIVIVESSKETVHILTGINPLGVEVPMKIQP